MNSQKKNRPPSYTTKTYVVASLLIIVGLLFLGRNLEIIDSNVFRIIVSWPMLLVALGLIKLFKRDYTSSIILFAIGLFFLVPKLTDLSNDWIRTYWPLIFVVLGIMFLFRPKNSFHRRRRVFPNEATEHLEDGFLNSESTFSSARHIVLDPVFKGAIIKSTFGSTVVDLRHTTLEAEEVIIDIDCTFAGVEIYAPNNWNIVPNTKSIFGACHDKRYKERELDYAHKVIIHGSIVFGGVEIKN